MREMVMRIKNNFVAFVEEFSINLKSNLIDMEKNATMTDCIGEDHKQEGRLKFLEDKH